MCVVSMVSDHYMHKWPLPHYVPSYEEYLNYRELLRKAAEYDRITGQKDCPSKDKVDWNKQLEEVFNQKYKNTYSFTSDSVFSAKDYYEK